MLKQWKAIVAVLGFLGVLGTFGTAIASIQDKLKPEYKGSLDTSVVIAAVWLILAVYFLHQFFKDTQKQIADLKAARDRAIQNGIDGVKLAKAEAEIAISTAVSEAKSLREREAKTWADERTILTGQMEKARTALEQEKAGLHDKWIEAQRHIIRVDDEWIEARDALVGHIKKATDLGVTLGSVGSFGNILRVIEVHRLDRPELSEVTNARKALPPH